MLILIFTINVSAASSTIVMDSDTNRILYQNNAYEITGIIFEGVLHSNIFNSQFNQYLIFKEYN